MNMFMFSGFKGASEFSALTESVLQAAVDFITS